jgi:hypothetical protein
MVIQAQNVVSPHELPLLDDVVAKSRLLQIRGRDIL